MKLIVGLGNPGKEYENTRHNIGYMVLNNFPGNNNWQRKFNGEYCTQLINGKKIIFLKPLTYMNLSGICVAEYVNYFKINTQDILIVQDDLDLPYLKFKIKYKSSSGGHNGIKSIISSLGTDAIPRLKIGISHDRAIDTKDYVLAKFNKEELALFDESSKKYNEIISCFINEDVNQCMLKYNRK